MSLSEKALQKSHRLLRHLGLLQMAGADSVRCPAVYTVNQSQAFLCEDTFDTRTIVPGSIPGSFITTAAIKDNRAVCIKSAFPNKRINLWRPFKTLSIKAIYFSAGGSLFRYPLSGPQQRSIEYIDDRCLLTVETGLTRWDQVNCENATWRMPSRVDARVTIQVHGEINATLETLTYTARCSRYTGLLLKHDFEYSEKSPSNPEHITPDQINTIFNNDVNVIGYDLIAK
jgi:hypothetical protein